MSNKSNPAKPPQGNAPNGKRPVNIFSILLYIAIFGVLIYMWQAVGGSTDPVKKEWLSIKDGMLASGDVEKIVFTRNLDKGEIYIKSDSVSKYRNQFGGVDPVTGPQFYFLVSGTFEPEDEFGRLTDRITGEHDFVCREEPFHTFIGHTDFLGILGQLFVGEAGITVLLLK